MTTNAILWITSPQLMLERVGGLSVLERHLFTAARAGIKRLWVGMPKPDEKTAASLRWPENLDILWSKRESDPSRECETPYLVISGDHFIRVETLRYIVEAPYQVHVSLHDDAGASVVQVVPFRTDRTPNQEKQPLPEGSTVFLERPVGRGPALSWLLAMGTKSQDGFMARHFDRHISLAVSRLLLDTPVTPNMMTVASSLIGLFGAAFFLGPAHGSRLTGAALVWLHSVLDGCDGELARIRFQESAFGSDIDFWGDNLVHLAMFCCLALGFYKADQIMLPLILGAAAAIGTAGSAWLAYLERVARRRSPQPAAVLPASDEISATLTRVENLLAARDFIYLLLFLAYIDRMYEFLWASAVGSLLFFFMLFYLGRRKREQNNQPHPAGQGPGGSPSAGNGGSHQHIYSGR